MVERGCGGIFVRFKFASIWIVRLGEVSCWCQLVFEEVVSSEVNIPIHQHLQVLKVNEDVKSRCVSLFGSSSSSSSSSSNLGYLPQ